MRVTHPCDLFLPWTPVLVTVMPMLPPSLPPSLLSFLPFSNGLVLFLILHLSIFDLTLILKVRSYILNREPETDLLSIY